MRFLIDSRGEIIESRRFARELGLKLSTVGQGTDLVKTNGYIWLEQRNSACTIRLRPCSVSPASEAALYYLMSDVRCSRVVVVSYTPEVGRHRIFPSSALAIKAIADELLSHRASTDLFASRRLEAGAIETFGRVKMLFDAFHADKYTKEAPHLIAFLTGALQDRYLLVERDESRKNLIVRALGSGYSGFDLTWAESAAGRNLDEQPDLHYGAWLAREYHRALSANVPVAEEVDAAIFRPKYGRRRFAYRRLLLPFTNMAGNQCLLSTSITDPTIDLGIN